VVDVGAARRHSHVVTVATLLRNPILFVASGFWIGSIPFGVLLAGRRGVDIRQQGSGNIGATNVARVLGLRAGLIVLVLDALKGALPTYLALANGPGRWVVVATGLAAILGHCFSPWLGYRGGKGVATALGVFAVIAPAAVVVALGVFAVVFAATRVPALGSLAGAAAITATLVVRGAPTAYTTLAVVTTLLLIYTHRGNLQRLRDKRR
jgi:glycerol-3-phosphate acyltransferase PlsY